MAKTLEQLDLAEIESLEQEILATMDASTLSTLGPAGLTIEEERVAPEQQPEIELPPIENGIRFDRISSIAEQLPNTNDDILANADNLILNPTIIENKSGKIGFVETFERKDIFEGLPFVGSVYKAFKMTNLMHSVQVLNDGDKEFTESFGAFGTGYSVTRTRTDAEKKAAIKRIESFVIKLNEEQERGISIGGRIAQGITELPAFMVEFLLTGPIFKTGSAAAKTAAAKLLGRFAEKGTGAIAVKLAGAGFGTLLRTGVNIPRVVEGALANMTQGITITDDGAIAFADADNPFTALTRSFADLYIENLTEIAGGAIGEGASLAGKGIGKKFPVLGKLAKEIGEKWVANKAGRTTAQFVKASASKVGFDGILQEMGEEQLGRILRSVTGLQTMEEMIPSMEDLLVEAGIFAVPGGVVLAQNQIFRKQKIDTTVLRDKGQVIEGEGVLRQEQGEPVTPEVLARDRISLFESEKNVKLSQEQNEAALRFIEDQLSEPPKKTPKKIIAKLPDDFEQFATEEDIVSKPFMTGAIEKKVVANTTKTKTESIQSNTKESAIEPTGTFDAIRRNISRAEDALGHWGTAGQKVQRDLREISFRTAKNVGITTQNIKPVLKGLSAAEKKTVAQLIDHAIPESGQPSRLIARADIIREQLDFMQNEAQAVGMRKGGLTGRAFPQVPNKKGKAFLEEAEIKGATSRRVFAWAQSKVSEGKFKTVDSAIAALQSYRKSKLRGTEGYFEGERTVDLDPDMREWNPDKILPGIIEGGWENIEGARQWGITESGDFKDIRTSIERIREEVGRDQANLTEDYIKAQYGQSRASVAAKRWSSRARATQFVGKLAFSPLTITRNILDRYAKGMTHGTIGTNVRATIKFPPIINAWMETSRKIQDEMTRQGAVIGHGHLSEGFDATGGFAALAGKPFALSEKGNQTYIALVKKMQLEADIKRLNEMGGETGTIGKMYNNMLAVVGKSQQQTRSRALTILTNEQLATALESGEIDSDTMAEVLHRTVTDSAFPLTLASKRMWWNNNPSVQVMTQFKVWSADQMRFIYKDVLEYTVATGDPSRMARFMIGTWLAGEMYNIARDFITGKDESLLSTVQDENGRNVKEISKSVANALVDGGVVGMIADLTYGVSDWAFGPTVGSIESLARTAVAVKNDPATSVDGLKQFLLNDIPAAKQAQGVLDRIDREFFEENNLTENYAKWRQRSFEFRKEKDELSTIERTTGRAILGRAKRVPGPRTLSLELISRQVLVGDIDDAADFIVGIFEDTKPEKLKDLRNSFRQSAINNSPMGNIKKDDVPKFLAQFSLKDQEQIKSLQLQWIKNYSEAMKVAGKRLEEDDFFGKLRKEFEGNR